MSRRRLSQPGLSQRKARRSPSGSISAASRPSSSPTGSPRATTILSPSSMATAPCAGCAATRPNTTSLPIASACGDSPPAVISSAWSARTSTTAIRRPPIPSIASATAPTSSSAPTAALTLQPGIAKPGAMANLFGDHPSRRGAQRNLARPARHARAHRRSSSTPPRPISPFPCLSGVVILHRARQSRRARRDAHLSNRPARHGPRPIQSRASRVAHAPRKLAAPERLDRKPRATADTLTLRK